MVARNGLTYSLVKAVIILPVVCNELAAGGTDAAACEVAEKYLIRYTLVRLATLFHSPKRMSSPWWHATHPTGMRIFLSPESYRVATILLKVCLVKGCLER